MNIGNVKIKGKAFLSPMAGTSNSAYMKICEEMDVGYAVTELISSEAITRGNKKTFDMLNGYDKLNIPVAVQLFGSNSKVMGEAARIIDDMKLFDVIDINMGCPVTKIAVSSSSGSALLKDPEKVGNIVSSVVSSVKVPVTVKIRSGWDHKSINACEIARICEENGASAITIHGRTRSDGYGGKVDLDIIKKVKESVSIPVIGNGDIKNGKDAKNMISYTKCDAVMVGRAALGNPWVFKNITNYFLNKDEYKPTLDDRVDMMKRHLDFLLEIKPERIAILEMRTNASY